MSFPTGWSRDNDQGRSRRAASSSHTAGSSSRAERVADRSRDSAEYPVLVVLCKDLDLNLDLLNAYARPTSSVITNAKIRDTLSRLPSHVSTFVMWRQSAAQTPHQWRSYEDARLQEGLGIIEDLKSCASYGRRNLQTMWHAFWNTGLTSFVQEVVVSRYPRWSQAYVVPMSELSPIALECFGRLRPLDSGLREAAVIDDETFAQCWDDWRGYRI